MTLLVITPALFISMSSPPNSLSTAEYSFSGALSDEMSNLIPDMESTLLNLVATEGAKSKANTLAPFSLKSHAVASPIPLAAPVITADLLFNKLLISQSPFAHNFASLLLSQVKEFFTRSL